MLKVTKDQSLRITLKKVINNKYVRGEIRLLLPRIGLRWFFVKLTSTKWVKKVFNLSNILLSFPLSRNNSNSPAHWSMASEAYQTKREKHINPIVHWPLLAPDLFPPLFKQTTFAFTNYRFIFIRFWDRKFRWDTNMWKENSSM